MMPVNAAIGVNGLGDRAKIPDAISVVAGK
jgi:hypothetical protein